jgi:hypothetical protein
MINRLLDTHLLPWSMIERLQRTYRLGRDLTLIQQALGHPNVEAWIKRVRDVQEARGTLDADKHLRHYDRHQTPPRTPPQRQALIAELESQMRVLEELLQRPTGAVVPYELVAQTYNRYVIRVDETVAFNFNRGNELQLVNNGLRFVVQWVNREERLLTLREISGLGELMPTSGALQHGTQNVPVTIQLERLQRIVQRLRTTNDRTTGSPAIDRLLGLAELTPSDPQARPVTSLVDEQIPYRKVSEFESEGDQAQEMAVQLAMNDTEALFIEGPPGTGKTKVIAEIIRQAVQRGKKVLLVSQMHQAVDNALEGLMGDEQVPVLRLGNNPSNFRYGTKAVWPGNQEEGLNEEVLREFQQRRQRTGGYVLAGTDIGIATDWALGRMSFLTDEGVDLVIMDEASRETLAGSLIPLSYLNANGKAIFVGDTKQLPPFGLTAEESRDLRRSGLSQAVLDDYNVSVFDKFLPQGYGDRVMLSTNYRSHPLIAGLVSELSYEGDVHRRGWEDFDAQTLSLRVIDIAEEPEEYYEDRGTRYRNSRSAERVIELVRLYQNRGIALEAMTVLTPYRQQVQLLEEKLREAYPGETNLPIVTTIDSYQGGENEAIIFDFVRSNPEGRIGFVSDLRRLNVGLSRAQENMAIIWDSRTFTGEARPTDTPADAQAREFFQRLNEYYETEVQTFFPEPAELAQAGDTSSSPVDIQDYRNVKNFVVILKVFADKLKIFTQTLRDAQLDQQSADNVRMKLQQDHQDLRSASQVIKVNTGAFTQSLRRLRDAYPQSLEIFITKFIAVDEMLTSLERSVVLAGDTRQHIFTGIQETEQRIDDLDQTFAQLFPDFESTKADGPAEGDTSSPVFEQGQFKIIKDMAAKYHPRRAGLEYKEAHELRGLLQQALQDLKRLLPQALNESLKRDGRSMAGSDRQFRQLIDELIDWAQNDKQYILLSFRVYRSLETLRLILEGKSIYAIARELGYKPEGIYGRDNLSPLRDLFAQKRAKNEPYFYHERYERAFLKNLQDKALLSEELSEYLLSYLTEGKLYKEPDPVDENAPDLLRQAQGGQRILSQNDLRIILAQTPLEQFIRTVYAEQWDQKSPASMKRFIESKMPQAGDYLRNMAEHLKQHDDEYPGLADKLQGFIVTLWGEAEADQPTAASSPMGLTTDEPVGGIDLNPAHLDLQIKRDRNGVPLPIQQQPIGNMHIEGFLPVIIHVTPVSLPLILGVADLDQPFNSAQGEDAGDNLSYLSLGPINLPKRLTLKIRAVI